MLQAIILSLVAFTISVPAFAADNPGPFPDVPANHWAAEAVKQMAGSGIMKGLPDGKFKGEKPVTRYELAVALARLVQSIDEARKPLAPQKEEKAIPAKTQNLSHGVWAKPSLDFLVSGGFLPKNTPLAKDGDKTVDSDTLANSFASVVARVMTSDAEAEAQQSSPSPEQPK